MGLPLAMDIYIPAVPKITHLFHTSGSNMQLTLSLFILTCGIIQLGYGPLTDKFGRRKIVALSVVIFMVGSLGCALAGSIMSLILGRITQAVGAAGMMVLGMAIPRDIYQGRKLAKCYSYLNGIISFSPMFGPFIGSFLDIHYGWPKTFESLLVLGVLTVVLYFSMLPETWPQAKRSNIKINILSSYLKIIREPKFFIYTLLGGFGVSYLFVFCAISPVLLISLLHIPESQYGFYFAFMGVSVLIGGFIAGKVVEHIGIYKTVFYGLCISFTGGLLMLIWYLLYGLTIDGFIWPMLLIGIGGTFCIGAGQGGAMLNHGKAAGLANALNGSFRLIYVAMIGLLISHFIHSTLPLAIPAVIQNIIGIIILLHNRRLLCSD